MKNNIIVLNSPAIADDGSKDKYRFLLNVVENPEKSTLTVQQKFNSGEWHGVPSGWYISTLLDIDDYFVMTDRIMIDGGQNWYVIGIVDALQECKQLLKL